MGPSPRLVALLIFSLLRLLSLSFCFEIKEATVSQIQQTSFEFYLREINRLNSLLRAVLEVNPDALDQADKEREATYGECAEGLHGIPVLLKDAGVVRRLRAAGAIILGKASMSEWAEFRSHEVPMGWNAIGGQPKVTNLQSTLLVSSPICLTVLDAVFVLDEIVGFDQRDKKATIAASKFIPVGGYKQFLKAKGKKGAILVDNIEISNINVILDVRESGARLALLYESKKALNAYLSVLLVRTLADVIAFNIKHSKEKLKEYGQDIFILAECLNRSNSSQVKRAISNLKELSRNGIEKVMREKKLDAILAPANTPVYTILAIGGYPGITVPAGYDEEGVPFGICFGGLRGSEPKLIEIAYSFEQATHIRRPLTFKS
ncbi:hypothetical protein AMTRI_Chr09g20960 [Amborella trichopoda]